KLLQDSNGAAAVVELRNVTARPLAGVPIAIDVEAGGGRSLFRNDAPGLEPSLVSAPLLRPRSGFVWVDDQLDVLPGARSVKAKVGDPRTRAAGSLPAVSLTRPRLVSDPVSGTAAEG